MNQINDAIHAWLLDQLGKTEGHINDLWLEFLIREGFARDHLHGMQYDYWGSLGYVGAYPDRRASWIRKIMPGGGPVIPPDDFIFYYTCDWTEGNRAPEIGAGVQIESAGNSQLVTGKVDEALLAIDPASKFQSAENVNLNQGTLGFWAKKRTITGTTSLPSLFRESGGAYNLRVFWAGDDIANGLGFRFGNTGEQVVPVDVPDGDWFFVECSWNIAAQLSSMRIDGRTWIRHIATGVTAPTPGIHFTIGHHQTQSSDPERYQDTIDQVFITDRVEADIYRYRYSSQIGNPNISEEDFSFYYTADWAEGNRAPEIGEGVQHEFNTNVSLVKGVVADAVEVGFRPLSFDTTGNIDFDKGTLGFWWKKNEFNALTSLPSLFRENGSGTTWRVSLVGPESGVAGDQPTMRFRWATDAEHIAVPPGVIGDWIFVEIAWNFADKKTAMRFNGGSWDEVNWPALTQGIVGGQWTIGIHQDKADYTDTFDQIFIARNYRHNIHEYRYSRNVTGSPPDPGPEPIRKVLQFSNKTKIDFATGWCDPSKVHTVEYTARLDGFVALTADVWRTGDEQSFGRWQPAPAYRVGRTTGGKNIVGPATAFVLGTTYTVTEAIDPPGTATVTFSGLGTASTTGLGTTSIPSPGPWAIGPRFGSDEWNGYIKDFKVKDETGTLIHHWPINDNVADGGTIKDVVGGMDGVLDMQSGSWIDDPEGTTEPPDPGPGPDPESQLVFQNDTFLRTPVTLSDDESYVITYEMSVREAGGTRQQFIYGTDDNWGTGKLGRNELIVNNAFRPMRSQDSSTRIDTGIVVGQLVHIEEEFNPLSPTAGEVIVKVNGVTVGSSNVGAGASTSPLSFGGRALMKGNGVSFHGVLRRIKIFKAGIKVHQYTLKVAAIDNLIVPDEVGNADAYLELGEGFNEPWETFTEYPEPLPPPTQVTVPEIRSLTTAEATAILTDIGLTLNVQSTAYNDTIAAGLIISQDPAAQTAVDINSAVNVVESLGVEPVKMQTVFKNTIITLPVNLDNTQHNIVEMDIRLEESGTDRAQEIWTSSDSHGSGLHSRLALEADNFVRPMRGSHSRTKAGTGMVVGEWFRITEALYPNSSDPENSYVLISVIEDQIDDVQCRVKAGDAGNVSNNIRLGGRLDFADRMVHASIKNVKIYNIQNDEWTVIHNYPMDEVLTAEGQTVRDTVGNADGTLTTIGDMVQEARELDLPPGELPDTGVDPDPPPDPGVDPDPPPDPSQFVLWQSDFNTTPVNTRWRGTNVFIRNDPTGNGKGRVGEIRWAPGNLNWFNKRYDLSRAVSEATFEYDLYMDPSWVDDWRNHGINAKMGGLSSTGAVTGNASSKNGWSLRMMSRGGKKWVTYKYFWNRGTRSGFHEDNNGRINQVGGWQRVKFWVKMNSAPNVKDGEYQFWINGATDGKYTGIPWMGPDAGTTKRIQVIRLEFFVNPGKTWPTAPRSVNTMYIANIRVTTSEPP